MLLEPTEMARLFAALLLERVEPSNLSRLPGHASPSQPVVSALVAPRSARTCRVVSCRVVSVACLSLRLSLTSDRSFVRFPATATNQTAAIPFPPFLFLRTLSFSPHKSNPIDFSPAAAATQPSLAQPLEEAQPSLLSQLISQLSQSDAKTLTQLRGNLLRLLCCFYLPAPALVEAGAKVQGQGQLSVNPQDLERDGHLSSQGIAAHNSRQLDLFRLHLPIGTT